MKKLFIFFLFIFSEKVSIAQIWYQLPGGNPDGTVTGLYYDSTYLWIGGTFSFAGSLSVQNVVRHNGANYIATPGLDGEPNGFVKFQGSIYAYGQFNFSGSYYGLAKFTGASWTPLMQITNVEFVYAATVYANKLVVGGNFVNIVGLPSVRLAQFNGSVWTAIILYGQIDGPSQAAPIRALAVNGLDLYIGGDFFDTNLPLTTPSSIAGKCLVWNGSTWSSKPIASDNTQSIYNFFKYQTNMYAVGNIQQFLVHPYLPGAVYQSCDAIVNGPLSGWTHWNCMGSGVPMVGKAGAEFNSKIYVGGNGNTLIYPGANDRLWSWDGSIWTADPYFTGSNNVRAMAKNPSNTILYVGGQFGFNNGNNIGNLAYTTTGIPLLVTLVSFSVELCKGSSTRACLSWQTESEMNNRYFGIERSIDGSQFDSIGAVPGAGNSENARSYNYEDAVEQNNTYYYRLKQVDYDGKVFYSALRAITTDMSDDCFTEHGMAIAPNTVLENGSRIAVYDIYGREVLMSLNTVDLDIFSPGLYLLSIIDRNGTRTCTKKCFVQ